MKTHNYLIYNASAGSGKTYTLVKLFLKIILSSPEKDIFNRLLAITFTNKAVAEMKTRVIDKLILFSDRQKCYEDTMFCELLEELDFQGENLNKKAEETLKHILHNYAGLGISTIDAFNHRLIRAFAIDLGINSNFEITLDQDELWEQAVHNLYQKSGENQELTDLLTKFSKDKIEEDKSWDMQAELKKIAQDTTSESYRPYIQYLNEKDSQDFFDFEQFLREKISEAEEKIQNIVQNFFNLMKKNGLSAENFKIKGSVYLYFEKFLKNPKYFPEEFPNERTWAKNIDTDKLYTKDIQKKFPTEAQIIDDNQQSIAEYFHQMQEVLSDKILYREIFKNFRLLMLLRYLSQEVKIIKEEENLLPIYEFNQIIHDTIRKEPALFIYEKMGERYRHYFIDEFQDTSQLQWENIQPLIQDALQSETLSQERGSLLLVGDAKQSIYRWRGGKAEQFIELYNGETNPFHIEMKSNNLEKNYRSFSQIIHFNNDFFSFISEEKDLFKTKKYQDLYKTAFQNTNDKEGGFVSIEFIEKKTKKFEEGDNYDEEEDFSEDISDYCPPILEKVEHALTNGFRKQDISILTRTNGQAIVVAEFLTKKGYSVISSESLLLKNIPEIQFLIHLIRLSINPNNQQETLHLLFCYTEIKQITEIHAFLKPFMETSITAFFEKNDFSLDIFHQYSLYEGVSYAIDCFALAKPSDAYLAFFLNWIYEFRNGRKIGIADFLELWEDQKDKLSLSAPEGIDAIRVMTIHKSKGLEFPVVIYPFVNDNFLHRKHDQLWLDISDRNPSFQYALVKNFRALGISYPETLELHNEQRLLDGINIMYVAMTRPVSHLYIISEYTHPKKPKKEEEPVCKTAADVLRLYLRKINRWNESERLYEFGKPISPKFEEKETAIQISFSQKPLHQNSYTIVTKKGLFWSDGNDQAIEKGNITHELLAKIRTETDILPTLIQAKTLGMIHPEQLDDFEKQLRKVMESPILAPYFNEPYVIYNEKEFIDSDGNYLRPDRIAFDPKTKEAVIIDYKTGKKHEKYAFQLKKYAKILTEIGWKVSRAYLVFINETIEVEAVKIT